LTFVFFARFFSFFVLGHGTRTLFFGSFFGPNPLQGGLGGLFAEPLLPAWSQFANFPGVPKFSLQLALALLSGKYESFAKRFRPFGQNPCGLPTAHCESTALGNLSVQVLTACYLLRVHYFLIPWPGMISCPILFFPGTSWPNFSFGPAFLLPCILLDSRSAPT